MTTRRRRGGSCFLAGFFTGPGETQLGPGAQHCRENARAKEPRGT